MSFLILFLPSFAFAEESTNSINFIDALFSANLIVQITFVILCIMSIVSWSIIFYKWSEFKKINKANEKLINIFKEVNSFESIYKVAQNYSESPLSHIFSNGYSELRSVMKSDTKNPSLYLDNIERALIKSSQNQTANLENGLNFLATTGNSCPFIGLFGTVFGIMDAFSKIAKTGSASLNVVAPGISEALIATGLGLFAAIPASIFYNTFISRIGKLELEFENFSTDFINITKRNFFKN